MASIQEHLDKIKNAIFGKDVRQSIHDGLNKINQETENTSKKQEKLERTFDDLIINAGNSNAEVAAARNGFETLGKRLDGVDSQLDKNKNEIITQTYLLKNSNIKTRLYAHRGLMSLYPQNTMYAFNKCLNNEKIYGIEIDLQITSDGIPVIYHDEKLESLTNGTGYIKERTYDYIKDLDCGYKFSTYFGGTKIPTLTNFLENMQGIKNIIFEIKDYRTIEDVKLYVQMIKEYGYEHKSSISTFDYVNLYPHIREISEDIEILCATSLEEGYNYFLPHLIKNKNSSILLSKDITTKERIKELEDNNIPLYVWTIKDSTTYRNLLNMGIKRFLVDREVN